ncbi:MAG TPA: hypothetical protein VMF61_00925 [Candidatus Acidoferrales bacterium]|nr:hypothetical protein [Candidatus Acidoferrales bacterium]
MAVTIAAATLAVVVAVSPAPTAKPTDPPYMRPPAGWTNVGPPPASAPVDDNWVSQRLLDGGPREGDSMEVWVRPIPPNSTLVEQVKEAAAEEARRGRTVASSRSHATCDGTQPGWTIDFRLPISPTLTVSRIEHLAVYEGYVYVLTFVHRADVPVDDAVRASIDSLCPKKMKWARAP